MRHPVVDAVISPSHNLPLLSRTEVARMLDASQGQLHTLFRNCSLAVLSTGHDIGDGQELIDRYPDFDVRVSPRERGLQLHLRNAPAQAFVDGHIIQGIREHLFAVLRDVVYAAEQIIDQPAFDLSCSDGLTDAVFHILRNAGVLKIGTRQQQLVVCWGGHAISRHEYDYSKYVGYHLGLRGLDVCTGCGIGAMKGPMKGAAVGHAKQRITRGRYIGISEPGIIAAEAPNPIVNALVIMPDIEKRLEAFVRMAHGIIIFPGGVGTAEEILYLLGILLHPDNAELPFPLIFTGPASAAEYFAHIDDFIINTLGEAARARYRIIIDDPEQVAREMQTGVAGVRAFRAERDDAYCFNWQLQIEAAFQQPFIPTHAHMAALDLRREQPPHQLAAQLRRAFSGVVAGNVKADGIDAVARHGPFELHGDPAIMVRMDALLTRFAEQKRMKLPGKQYQPCYRIVR